VIVNNLTSNIDQFSNLFHYQNQEKICNNVITKDPTTPQVSLLYSVKCQCLSLKATTENKTSVPTHFKQLMSRVAYRPLLFFVTVIERQPRN